MQISSMSIQVKSVNKSYGSNQILHNISFECAKGETLVLLGPSGAGKSSLLRVLNLLESADNGQLTIANQAFDFASSPSEADGLLLRRKVGMVFQQYNLWPHLTVIENLIEAPIRVLGVAKTEAIEQAREILATLQLADKSDAWPLQLSGGQQQRVAIARALMMKPEVLLFDEPTAALDPEITNQVVKIISGLSDTGITQVVVTHEVDFAKKIASHVLYLEKGHIVEHGTKQAFSEPQTRAFAEYLKH
ncbi:arginine ABC transporter ATP-binding protein ArtP [Vibrio sp. IRLE0018]|nr:MULTISPECIES: arginine ABC transporter ATP-binding protein ArtP [Vibrio]EID4374742.1 arginine ABC transporter ATP-binding protein ArtP [Vibrio vulnificus]MCF8779190.1 arginine ABC transporter ATP-binding protein ArtP [Vibrio floridensis]MCU8112063.1 arginine ABC transporter ATP-binding protein ArtP [Vibrio vulnificus]MCU8306646.1 arginine ABC transporter ATP-binding protein ArtP [Vibrio vulnificus]HDY7878960.1 arginine ABC transporter ATP-binding protein ArtP [Vibrio vulnificus]